MNEKPCIHLVYNLLLIYKKHINTNKSNLNQKSHHLPMRGNDVFLELNEKLCQVFVMK
jgi:hypothetical protein